MTATIIDIEEAKASRIVRAEAERGTIEAKLVDGGARVTAETLGSRIAMVLSPADARALGETLINIARAAEEQS